MNIHLFYLFLEGFFCRLKGLTWSEIPQICDDMINLFGLELYKDRKVEKLRLVFSLSRRFVILRRNLVVEINEKLVP